MADRSDASSGVQELISRIRDAGVGAGKEEAQRLVADAKTEAARILREARAEAAAMRKQATADIDKERLAAVEALHIASRDTVLELRGRVTANFERYVKRLITQGTRQNGLLRGLVLVLAGHAAEEHIQNKDVQILVAEGLLGDQHSDEISERQKAAVLRISADMLRDGVELIPSSEVAGGARVRLVGEDVEIDLSDKAISALMLKFLLPRFRAIVEGSE